ncbi:hypothetical protein ANN_28054 [Periplaneta americana]|uniref:CCHC-type domain-containing protein n=1 Tax=Periplaneta americana TaxID=6978 RepID=A0ABQ8RUN3_PERAM|nr:hypothetical protein ANN_28054 [Periplaneta americana]
MIGKVGGYRSYNPVFPSNSLQSTSTSYNSEFPPSGVAVNFKDCNPVRLSSRPVNVRSLTKQTAESKLGLIKVKYERLDSILLKYEESQVQLEMIGDKEHSEDRIEFEEQYDRVKSRFLTIMESRNNVAQDSNQPIVEGKIKLPIISLPSFNGDYRIWLNFRDTFSSLIVKNSDLAEAQKMHYSLSALKGEPHKLVENLTICDVNFRIAWDMVYQRYNNEKLIASKHAIAILSLPTISKESHGDLRSLVSQVKSNMNALEALPLEVPLHEILLLQLILEKIDTQSRREWELSCADRNMSTLKELLDFLEHKYQALETIKSMTPIPEYRVKFDRGREASKALIMTQPICYYCNQWRSLYNCQAFSCSSMQEKNNCVLKHRLCWNCLRSQHLVKDCRARTCEAPYTSTSKPDSRDTTEGVHDYTTNMSQHQEWSKVTCIVVDSDRNGEECARRLATM